MSRTCRHIPEAVQLKPREKRSALAGEDVPKSISETVDDAPASFPPPP